MQKKNNAEIAKNMFRGFFFDNDISLPLAGSVDNRLRNLWMELDIVDCQIHKVNFLQQARKSCSTPKETKKSQGAHSMNILFN